MKTKIMFSLILFLTTVSFVLKSVIYEYDDGDKFLIMAYHSGIDTHYTYYPQLNVNAWHHYTAPKGWGWPEVYQDNYDQPSSVYGPTLSGKIDSNRAHGLSSIMDRPKTQYLLYGQRSDYQCENIPTGDAYWFYAYDYSASGSYISDITDNSSYGNGARVKYCQANPSDPESRAGYVVKDLRANREQAEKGGAWWKTDTAQSWFVMPRIRIDSTVVYNSPQTKVCAICIYEWDGNRVDSVEILARNFRVLNGQYTGNYIEEYNFSPDNNKLEIDSGNLCPGPAKNIWDWGDSIKTDFRVYWYGQCDMWIDYVRVENLPAHQLFHFDPTINWDNDLEAEVNLALNDGNNPIPNNFYADEFDFNNIPCISYVNKKIREYSQNKLSVMAVLNYPQFKKHINPSVQSDMTAAEIKRYFIDSAQIKYLLNFSYPLEGWKNTGPPPGYTGCQSSGQTVWETYHPSTLSNDDYNPVNGILSYKTTVSDYENKLQERLDEGRGSADRFTKILKLNDEISKFAPDLTLMHIAQDHMWWSPFHRLKEPSNEEIRMMTNVSVTYGAKGILHFAFNSEGGDQFDTSHNYSRGLAEPDQTPRTSTVYGQNKWLAVKQIDSILQKWAPYLINLDNANRKSYIFRLEKDNLLNETYFKDILSFKQIESSFPAHQTTPEPISQRYLQTAVFNNPDEAYSRYFMIVNRRCSPFDDSEPDIESGIRFIQIRLDSNSSAFSNFNNWSIYDLGNDSLITTIDKTNYSTIDLGWYLPGEGKLYKIAPVMQEGGELIADENVTASEFICNSDVYSENKDITINPGVTVSFADTVKWEFTGGIINIGTQGDNTAPVFLKNRPGQSWKGISIINSSSVNIFRTTFSGLKNNSTALSLLDNYEYNVSNNTFNLTDLDSVSAIEVDYVMPSDTLQSAGCGENCEEDFIYVNGFINENTINTTSSILPSVKCFAYGQYIVALMMNRNVLNSAAGTIAVLLSNTTSGNIKNNKIYNYNTGICIYSPASYCDLYHNEIIGDSTAVKIFNSTINPGMQDYTYTGGFNLISSLKNNINTNEGYFSLSDGLNTFNIDHQTSPNLEGTFDSENSLDEYAGDNCFKTFSSSGYSPRENVTCTGLNCDVTFFFNQICAIEQTEEYLVIDVLGDGSILDTIWIENSGEGGGEKINYKLQISNYKFATTDIAVDNSSGIKAKVGTMRELYNTICIEMRKRNFNAVHDKCIELLNNYADSSEATDAASKLYLSDLVIDSSGNRLSSLKSYFETLILNNGSNERLIRQLFYLVQKCKTALGEYQSAMSGFQQIIEQNPYNYLGLVASWDFSDTSLLNNIHGGSGGGIKNYLSRLKADELKITNEEIDEDDKQIPFDDSKSKNVNPKSKILTDDPNEKYDKSKFTKEDIKLIKENVIKSYENSREKETKRLNYLEEKISEGKANENEKSELSEKRTLSEVVKIKEPEDIKQHLELVNSDLKKLFGAGRYNSSVKNEINTIPDEYRLYQNYPNPFNPETKIEFELPEDTKVTLIIYNILGREIKRLLNNEYRISGRYSESFNGKSASGGLPSGVYFYTLRADEFVQSKRMVLIK